MMDKMILGQPVTILAFVTKEYAEINVHRPRSPGRYIDHRSYVERHELAEPQHGILIGYRTWSVGKAEWWFETAEFSGGILSSGKQYRAEHYYRVALVVTSLYCNPVACMPEDLIQDAQLDPQEHRCKHNYVVSYCAGGRSIYRCTRCGHVKDVVTED